MLRSIIVSTDRELTAYLDRALAGTGEISVVRMVDHYADSVELSRVLRAHGPQVVFVTLESAAEVARIAAHVDRAMPSVQTVAIGRSTEPQAVMDVMRAGIREFLAAPLHGQCVDDCIQRLKQNLTRHRFRCQHPSYGNDFSLPNRKPEHGSTTQPGC